MSSSKVASTTDVKIISGVSSKEAVTGLKGVMRLYLETILRLGSCLTPREEEAKSAFHKHSQWVEACKGLLEVLVHLSTA